jgi:hypothetical protein
MQLSLERRCALDFDHGGQHLERAMIELISIVETAAPLQPFIGD